MIKWEVSVAKGYRVANDIILGGAAGVVLQVYALASARESTGIRLDDERGTIVELGGMGKLKSGQTWAWWEMDPG